MFGVATPPTPPPNSMSVLPHPGDTSSGAFDANPAVRAWPCDTRGSAMSKRVADLVVASDKKRLSPADNAPSASTERTDDTAQDQRAHLLGTGSGRHAFALGSARSFEPQGHQIWMRNSAMRRLHRTPRRPSRSVLQVAGGERGLSRSDDDRGNCAKGERAQDTAVTSTKR